MAEKITEYDNSWIFGYGSLVWRPAFDYAERRAARVSGWARRFWQGSTDHRGVPGKPGRVVTLLRQSQAETWGMAYRLVPEQRASVLEQLDHREKGGYQRRQVSLRFLDGSSTPGLMYLAAPANPDYLGPAPLQEIAAQVRASSGPSGPNVEYVLRLAEALRAMGADAGDDEHLFALEALLRG